MTDVVPGTDTMTAVGFHEHGDVDRLELLDVAVPGIDPNEVLVDVKATSLNHQDLFAVRELDHYITEYPFWGGGDTAGVVAAVGDAVTDRSVGDRVLVNSRVACRECDMCLSGEQSMCRDFEVYGEHRRGGFAEYLDVPERNLYAVPDGWDLAEAAAVPIAAGCAWRALANRGQLSPSDEVLVVGATGGVGTYAVQVAREVFDVETLYATTSTDEKAEFLRGMGVDHVVDYTEESFDSRIWELTEKQGVDLVYNTVGGDTWVPSMRSLRPGGRLVSSGATAGPNPETEIRLVFMRQLELIGSTSHSHTDFEQVLEKVWSGVIDPIVERTYPLTEYATAFERMADRDLIGKLVLTQDDGD
jgi:NADPH:quinone reductase-like Zn-dependent oxidoreductase